MKTIRASARRAQPRRAAAVAGLLGVGLATLLGVAGCGKSEEKKAAAPPPKVAAPPPPPMTWAQKKAPGALTVTVSNAPSGDQVIQVPLSRGGAGQVFQTNAGGDQMEIHYFATAFRAQTDPPAGPTALVGGIESVACNGSPVSPGPDAAAPPAAAPGPPGAEPADTSPTWAQTKAFSSLGVTLYSTPQGDQVLDVPLSKAGTGLTYAAKIGAEPVEVRYAAVAVGGSPGAGGGAGALAGIAESVTLGGKPLPERSIRLESLQTKKLAEWRREDYLRAKQEGERRLAEAVDALVKRSAAADEAQRERAAEWLGALLKHDPPEPPKTAAPPGAAAGSPLDPGSAYRSLSPDAIQKVCEGLAALGSPAAVRTLRAVVEGSYPTDDDRAAATAALDAVIHHLARSPDYEALAFDVLTNPKGIRRPPAGAEDSSPAAAAARDATAISGEELQKQTLDAIKPIASPKLRARIAGHLIDPRTAEELRQTLGEFLLAPHPDNLAAQIAIYGGGQALPEVRENLEKYFTQYSGAALAVVLGLAKPPGQEVPGEKPDEAAKGSSFGLGGRPGAAGGLQAPPRAVYTPPGDATLAEARQTADPYQSAAQLWSERFAELLAQRLAGVEALDKHTNAVLLAATVPTDAVRGALFQTLKKHHASGPASLHAAGWLNPPLDPGLVVLVKALPRETPANQVVRMPGMAEAAAAPQPQAEPGRPGPRKRESPAAKPRAKPPVDDTAAQDWMGAGAAAAMAVCDELAALKRPAQQWLPDELHLGNARVLAEFKLALPEDAVGGDKLPGVKIGATQIRYARMELAAPPARPLALIKRKLPKAVERLLPHGYWLESCRPIEDGARWQSVDVLITRAAAAEEGQDAPPAGAAGPARLEKSVSATLLVQFLVVDIAAPPSQRAGAKQTPKKAPADAEKAGGASADQ